MSGKIQNEDVKTLAEIEAAVLSTTGNTNGNNQLTNLASTANLVDGLYIYGSGIPLGTTILNVSGTTVTMSQNAMTSLVGTPVTFGGTISQLINDTKIYVSALGIDDTLYNAIVNGDLPGNQKVVTVSGTSQAIAASTKYYTSNSALTTFTLPASPTVGDQYWIVSNSAGGWQINNNTGQPIIINGFTTNGAPGGSIASTTKGAAVYLSYAGGNNFIVESNEGTINVNMGFALQGYFASYFAGGDYAGSRSGHIQQLLYSGEVISDVANSLPTPVALPACGIFSNQKGYISGGDDGGSLGSYKGVQTIVFSGLTTALLSATLTQKRYVAGGTTTSLKGYIMGGSNDSSLLTSIDRITYSGETITNISAVLTSNWEDAAGGLTELTIGYNAGGSSFTATPIITIDTLTFSGETTGSLVATLTSNRDLTPGGASSTLKAYIAGGTTNSGLSGITNTIDALTFSGQTVALVTATLTTGVDTVAGSPSSLKGYFAGGENTGGSSTNTVQTLVFSGETTGVVVQTLTGTLIGAGSCQI